MPAMAISAVIRRSWPSCKFRPTFTAISASLSMLCGSAKRSVAVIWSPAERNSLAFGDDIVCYSHSCFMATHGLTVEIHHRARQGYRHHCVFALSILDALGNAEKAANGLIDIDGLVLERRHGVCTGRDGHSLRCE